MREDFIKKLGKKYKGKWIAVKGDNLLAISDNHRELYKELKEKNK